MPATLRVDPTEPMAYFKQSLGVRASLDECVILLELSRSILVIEAKIAPSFTSDLGRYSRPKPISGVLIRPQSLIAAALTPLHVPILRMTVL